ncbi:MAG: PDGLE domain-containing protein [Candidatus Aureabacteria bacterium]|nr:PDGLE domain-containing protein [Candidatus Auribacterota bacterium]
MKITTKLWLGIVILALLSPLGILLPEHFKAGDAWGEWGSDTIKGLVGYVPQGLEKLSNLWGAPIPDYAFKGWEEKGLSRLSIAYIFSAILGVVVTAAAVLAIGKLLVGRGD